MTATADAAPAATTSSVIALDRIVQEFGDLDDIFLSEFGQLRPEQGGDISARDELTCGKLQT